MEIICRIDDDVPECIKGDPGRFRQVLVNLMGNATKFTESGEIELSLGVEEEQELRVKLRASIRDTGVGVAHDKLEKIFEAFQQADGFNTRKYEGSGLGLTICKQISHLLGGDVTAQSTLGEGSVFHFTAWFERAGVRKKSDVRSYAFSCRNEGPDCRRQREQSGDTETYSESGRSAGHRSR